MCRDDGGGVENKGMVPVSRLSEKGIWILQAEETLKKIEKIQTRGPRLREIADIHVGIQTLADDVFILEKIAEKSGAVVARAADGSEVQIETAITRPILKASVMKNGRDVKERIVIFPYVEGKLISEPRLRKEFPLAHRYLSERKDLLLKRDKGEFDTARWYAFGREFGLTTTFGDKLLTSGMNKKPNFQKCPAPEYTFYSGYCIKPKRAWTWTNSSPRSTPATWISSSATPAATTSTGGNPMRRRLFRTTACRGRSRAARGGSARGKDDVRYNFRGDFRGCG